MNGLVDYHLHSRFSPDGQEDILSLCQKAQDLGLAEICLTDHADFDPHDWGYGNYKYEALQAQIAQVRARFGQNSLRIGFGVEISYEARHEDEIRQFLQGKEFDFVLGSIHRAGGLSLEGELYTGRTEEKAVGLYFGELLHGIKSGLFDVMAHLDLVKRYSIAHYGKLSFAKYRPYYEEVLRAMVEHGVGLEVNTSGLRQAAQETYPGEEALKLYRELGGEIVTLGSDAHWLGHLGFGLERGLEMIRNAGFEAITLYHRRQPQSVKIV